MPSGSTTLHEDDLPDEVVDRHRAIVSIMEELEAVDWYDQRVAAATDPELADVLAHSRDEEKEHAMMTLEWLRRHDPALDEMMRTYLFVDGSILAAEEGATGADGGADAPADDVTPAGDGSLRIGSLRGATNPAGGLI